MDDKYNLKELKETDEILNLYTNMTKDYSNVIITGMNNLEFPNCGRLAPNEYSFFRVTQLSFDDDYPKREAMENVLLSMDNEAFNFVYILTGSAKGVDLCLGVVKNGNSNETILNTKLSAANYSENISKAFEGNFNGSKLEKLRGDELAEMAIYSTNKYRHAGIIQGVPSIDEKEGVSNDDFQGIDRLINSMLGQTWRLVIICEPVTKSKILDLKTQIYDFYNRMSVWSKSNIQRSQNWGKSITTGSNESDSRSKNKGTNSSDSTSSGHSSGSSDSSYNSGSSHSKGTSEGISISHTTGTSNSDTTNTGRSEAITVEKANKAAQEMMQFIDEELLKRLKIGSSKRIFNTSVIYMAENPASANRLKVGIMSLFQGNNPSYSPLTARSIDINDDDNRNTLSVYQNRNFYEADTDADIMTLM
jgi:hypothetical protein